MEEDAKALAVRVVVFITHFIFFQSRGINNTDVQQPMKHILFCVLLLLLLFV